MRQLLSHDFCPHLGAKRIVFRNVPGSEGYILRRLGHSTNYPTQADKRPYPLHPALSSPTSVLEIKTPRVLKPVSSQHLMGCVNHRSSALPPVFPSDPSYKCPGCVILNNEQSSSRDVPRSHNPFPIPQPPGNHQCPPGHPQVRRRTSITDELEEAVSVVSTPSRFLLCVSR